MTDTPMQPVKQNTSYATFAIEDTGTIYLRYWFTTKNWDGWWDRYDHMSGEFESENLRPEMLDDILSSNTFVTEGGTVIESRKNGLDDD